MATGVQGFDPNRLASARAKTGLSYRALAALLGVTYSTVRQWEHGISKPRPSYLNPLAKTLGCTVHYLAPLPSKPTLIDYRERAGLTLEDVAALVDRHFGTVSRIEHGVTWPEEPARWAEAYGLSPAVFRSAWRRGVLLNSS